MNLTLEREKKVQFRENNICKGPALLIRIIIGSLWDDDDDYVYGGVENFAFDCDDYRQTSSSFCCCRCLFKKGKWSK